MRWNAVDPKEPREGEKRKTLKYAWLPTLVENKYVWLESYWYWEIYSPICGWEECARYLT
jgi:hypothetical protein